MFNKKMHAIQNNFLLRLCVKDSIAWKLITLKRLQLLKKLVDDYNKKVCRDSSLQNRCTL